MKRTIRGIRSPGDDITVEMKSMFADPPSASLTITRHGVPEHNFACYELVELAEAIKEMEYMLDHHPRASAPSAPLR